MIKLQRAQKIGRKFQSPVPAHVGGFSTMAKALPRMILNRKERVPAESIGPFVTDPRAYAALPSSGLRVTWFGHSSTLLEIDGVRVLVDPVWDERASPLTFLGPKRFFPPTIDLAQLPPADAILISHDHYDHLGRESVEKLAALMPRARWITSLGVARILQGFGVAPDRIRELDWTETAEVDSPDGARLSLVSLPSRHFSGRSLSNRNETLWASFVLRGARHTVYFGADSGPWEGFASIGRDFGPFDLVMLEIGAADVLWRDIHLGPDAAADALAQLGGGLLMPIHWGLFDLALHGWRDPIERMLELAAERGLKLFSPEPGQPTEVGPAAEHVSAWWKPKVPSSPRA